MNSKSKENSETLKRRLSLWWNGQLDQLMFEAKTIQDRVENNDRTNTKKKKRALTFARLIKEWKVNKAIKILEKGNTGGILPLSDGMFEILQQKHSEASEGSADILLEGTPPSSTSCYLRKYKFRNG